VHVHADGHQRSAHTVASDITDIKKQSINVVHVRRRKGLASQQYRPLIDALQQHGPVKVGTWGLVTYTTAFYEIHSSGIIGICHIAYISAIARQHKCTACSLVRPPCMLTQCSHNASHPW
jgi:hypothetical protein